MASKAGVLEPDRLIAHDTRSVRLGRTKTVGSLLLGAALAAVCIPAAILLSAVLYVLSDVATFLGVDTGWSEYLFMASMYLTALPLFPFWYFFGKKE